MRRDLVICVGLAALTFAAYWSVGSFDFVNYDDKQYVYENSHVLHGLNAANFRWSLTAKVSDNWHPLTLLSHGLDVELFGLRSGCHHGVNLAFHAANVLLVFFVLRRMTGAVWRSAIVAALFALHPLNVESVAWIAERKNVLSTFFCLLTLAAYSGYVRTPGLWRYSLVFVLFAMGLMAKPMLVTLPFALLLLDYWPLGRIRFSQSASSKNESQQALQLPNASKESAKNREKSRKHLDRRPQRTRGDSREFRLTARGLILEKTPLFMLSIFSCIATWIAQQQGMASVENVGLGPRIGNALLAYASYLGKMFWPFDLALPYPFSYQPDWTRVFLALILLVAISFFAIGLLRFKRPYFAMGWFWFLGTLVPVIGIVKVGIQGMADRHAYIPLIGLFIVLVWGAADLTASWKMRPAVLGVITGTLLIGCFFRTQNQVQYWRNSETLFLRSLAIVSDNYTAHNNLSAWYWEQKRHDESADHAKAALKLKPNDADAIIQLAVVAIEQKQWDEAGSLLKNAMQMDNSSPAAHNHYAAVLLHENNIEEAISHLREAARLDPDELRIRKNLAKACEATNKWQDAADQWKAVLQAEPRSAEAAGSLGAIFQKLGHIDQAEKYSRLSLEIDPNNVDIRHNLAVGLLTSGKTSEALAEWRKILPMQPNDLVALNNIAWVEATGADPALRNGKEAVEYAEKIAKLSKEATVDTLDTLAAAYAESGRFPEAIATATKAADLADSLKQPEQATEIRKRVSLYQTLKPYREMPKP